ncbi:hypothetical protein L7F22_028877 [Adiantum nelumboides]|nr:hypothetical protein [Adiantum nelumboides]
MSSEAAETWSSRRQLVDAGLKWVAEPPDSLLHISANHQQETVQSTHNMVLIGLIGMVCIAALAVIYFRFFYKYCNACDVGGGLQRNGSRLDYMRRAAAESAGSGVVGSQAGGAAAGNGSSGGGLPVGLIKLLPSLEFDEKVMRCEEERDCSICLTHFLPKEEVRLLPSCAHLFHQSCIDAWLLCHASCPLCRSGIFLPMDKIPSFFAHLMSPTLPYTRDFSITQL